MNKRSIFGPGAILAVVIFAAPVNGQEKFPPLTSKCEGINRLYLEISSEVKIEKKEKAPPVYVTIFTFTNRGEATVRFIFVDENFSIYAAVAWSLETDDFSVFLKPKEVKTIKIQTSAPPAISLANNFVSIWRPSEVWDGSCFSYSYIYAPIVYEPPMTSATAPIPREPNRVGGRGK